ncbi:hypothetical protein C8R43DRAFT_184568 [Mycena crocata]|nr:hypothetical protein C8R43DRAFT_184568 [Mycena crocata]
MNLSDFPPELLTRIFLQLSYKSLLCVLAVSAQWNAIVADDPALKVQMFKSLSKEYVEEGSSQPVFMRCSSSREIHAADSVRLHPALQMASYSMGEPSDAVYFLTPSYIQRRCAGLQTTSDYFLSVASFTP